MALWVGIELLPERAKTINALAQLRLQGFSFCHTTVTKGEDNGDYSAPKRQIPSPGAFKWLHLLKDLSSPNFLYQYFLISLLVFQVLEVAYSDRDAA